MDKLFSLTLNHQPEGRYRSLWFDANVDGETISVGKLNDEKNEDYYKNYEKGLAGKKEIFDVHKDYISYELLLEALVKSDEFECGSWAVDIGKRKSITREELIELLKKEIDSYDEYSKEYELDKLKRIDWDTAQYRFRSMYDYAFYDFNENRVYLSRLTEFAIEIVKNKSLLEKIIKSFENADISNKQFLSLFFKAYSIDNKLLVDKIIKNRLKNPQTFEIKTELAGPPSLWTEGHGRDFSYQFTPTKKHLIVYAEDGTTIDTNKVYTKEEVKQLMKDKKLILVYEYGLYGGKITDNTSNITQKEIDKTIRDNITKQMLLKDYKKFMNFYKLAKIEIGLKFKQLKEQNNKKVAELRRENTVSDNTIKLLDENEEMKL